MASPLLFVTLILCSPSPGSLQPRYGWGRAARSRGGGAAVVVGDSLEGSGRSVGWPLRSGATIPKRPQPNQSERHIKNNTFSRRSRGTLPTYSSNSLFSRFPGALRGLESPQAPVLNQEFTSVTTRNQSTPGSLCVFCDILPNPNGTNLVWEDMRRTLAFAWELHVFGSSSLFVLMAALAAVGTAGAGTVPAPVSYTLTLANCLLLLAGALRGALLLLDPYGTRQVLPRPSVVALHNLPLQLLLWAQAALSLVTLRRLDLLLFSLRLDRPWSAGGLALLHCSHLVAADLLSPSPTVPLLLHTLSLCWGLPLSMAILLKSCSSLHPSSRSPVPEWAPPWGAEKRAKRVTAACALLGVLCCGLQTHSLLWLYGLLGNWRRFGWGWWLSQFWARILELSWGFSLLVLASWIFWTPSKRGEKGQSKKNHRAEKKSFWGQILAKIKTGPLKKSERTLEELMPNNWAKYNLSKTGFGSNVRCPYDLQPTYTPNPDSPEARGAHLWRCPGDLERVLSLGDFDMQPPSPINLRRSIDDALLRGQLAAWGAVSAPASSWITPVGGDAVDGGGHPSAYRGWTLDAEPASTGPFPVNKPLHIPRATADHSGHGFRSHAHPGVMYLQEWLEDDVTDL